MFKIIVYSYIKKVNSTKRVTKNDALTNTEMDCQINWNGCGIVNPHIRINYGVIKSPTNFNYAYIPAFKRYYFCMDWTFIDGLWESNLQEDFLATWRDDILSYTAWVWRAADSAYWNNAVSDTYYPVTANITINSAEVDCPWNFNVIDSAAQGFIVGIIGESEISASGAMGSVTYYRFRLDQMQNLSNKLLHNTDWMNISWDEAKRFLTDDLLKSLFNPIQYIASAVWFPNPPSDIGTLVTNIKFGFWELNGVPCYKLTPDELHETFVLNIDIPKHPQSSIYGKWLNLSPYTYYQAHVPPFGLIDIPADELQDSSTFAVEYVVDYSTGDGRIMCASSNRFINIVNCKLGAPIAISQAVNAPLEAISSGARAIGQIASGYAEAFDGALRLNMGDIANGLSGIIENVPRSISDMAKSIAPTVQSQGTNGSQAWYHTGERFVRLSAKCATITDHADDIVGRPVCKKVQLSSLSGFVKCGEASVSFEGTGAEQQVVNQYLNSGVYIE